MRNILLTLIALILTIGIYIIDKNLAELVKVSTPEYINVVPDKVIIGE